MALGSRKNTQQKLSRMKSRGRREGNHKRRDAEFEEEGEERKDDEDEHKEDNHEAKKRQLRTHRYLHPGHSMEENLSRQKWLEHMKSRREESIALNTERNLVRRAMKEHPEIFQDKNAKLRFQSDWVSLMPHVGEEERCYRDGLSGQPQARLSLPPSESLEHRARASSASEGESGSEEEEIERKRHLSAASLSAVVGTVKDIPTPVTYEFLERTVGPEGVRKSLIGSGSDAAGARHDNELLSKYIQRKHSRMKKQASVTSQVTEDVEDEESDASTHSNLSEKPSGASLIDSILLIGPAEKDMDKFVDAVIDECVEVNPSVDEDDDLDSRPRGVSVDSAPLSKPQTVKRTKSLNPDMLYMTSENPLIENDVLPFFCFPRGIESTAAVYPTKIAMTTPRRKPSPRYINRQKQLFQTKTSFGTTSCNRFVFLLSNHTSNQFGICMTVPRIVTFERRNQSLRVKTSYCLTILTEYPFFSFFFQLLTEYINMKGFCADASTFISKQQPGDLLQYELRQLESFAMKLSRHAVPHPGQSVLFGLTLNMVRHEVTINRLLISDRNEENCIGTLIWGLPILLKNLELDLVLEVLGCLLTEMKVVIRCKNLEILSACVLSFFYLLKPLKWVCPVIVILPSTMHDFLDSPVPVILGMESTPPSFVMSSGLIVVDPEQKVIHWHPSDLVTKKALALPRVSKLQQQLKPLVDSILKLVKKHRKPKQRAFSFHSTDSSDLATASADSELTTEDTEEVSNNEDLKHSESTGSISVETKARKPALRASITSSGDYTAIVGNDDFVQSPLLASAIASFSTTLSQHLLKIGNTAMQMKWKLTQLRQQQRLDLANVPREQPVGSRTIASDESIGSHSEASLTSDKTKLPAYPPPPGAVCFSHQELGSSGITFMNSFIQSQMFCNYCQRYDEEQREINERDVLTVSDNNKEDNDTDESDTDADIPPQSPTQPVESNLLPLYPEETPRKDPLISLFSIILSGSCELSSEIVEEVMDTYQRIYSPLDVVTSDDAEKDKLKCSFNLFVHVEDTAELESTLQCNGRCNGLANTSSCTSICLQLWEQRTQVLRRHANVNDIIRRRGAILAPGASKNSVGQVVDDWGQTIGHTAKSTESTYRNALPQRHKRETIKQYTHRASLITGRSEHDILAELSYSTQNSPTKHSGVDSHPHLLPLNLKHDVQQSQGAEAKPLPRESRKNKKVSSGVAALSSYFKRKKANNRSPYRVYRLLTPEERVNYVKAVVLVQSSIRRYIVRNNIETIVESLRDRKLRRQESQSENEMGIGEVEGKNETEQMLSQSDQQYYDEDLLSTSNGQTFDNASDRSSSGVASAEDTTKKTSKYLLGGLLPVPSSRTLRTKQSLSLSPSHVFAKARCNSKPESEVLASASMSAHDSVRRSHSDNFFSVKPLHPQPTSTLGHVFPAASNREEKLEEAEEDKVPQLDESIFDTLSPRMSTPDLHPNVSDDRTSMGSSSPFDFDESLLNPAGVPLPVHSLGPRAGDILSRSQQKTIVSLWVLLRHGIFVFKHGRSGRPKKRILYCNDDNLQVLYLRDASGAEELGNSQVHSSADMAFDHSKRRSSFSVFTRPKREIVLRDVIEVRDDLSTDVMQRSIAKKYTSEAPSVLSFILKDQKPSNKKNTLDLEIGQEHWGVVHRALQIIVEYYQTQLHMLEEH